MNPKKVDQIIKLAASLAMIVSFLGLVAAQIFVEIPEANEKLVVHTLAVVETGLVSGILAYFYTKSHPPHKDSPEEP